jgi:SDR family mycofactocin-dependent oxidoreductase
MDTDAAIVIDGGRTILGGIMAGRVEGKVAFITGAGRGQGRSHAIRLAQEGADIIAVDICRQIESNPYPLSSPEDLAETERAVKELGRRVVARQADVRDREELGEALQSGLADLGRLDIVVANAGILPMAMGEPDPMDFVDAVDVDLGGVMNAVSVSIPNLPDSSSIIVTGSTAGLMPGAADNPVMGPGGAGYSWSKKTLVGYVEQLALHLAPRFIRVNAIHPTNCDTHLLHNDGLYSLFRPDVENPTREDVLPAFTYFQAMPIPYVEPVDISNLVLFLASDESRYITGQQIRVDAGSLIKFPNGPA